MRIFRILCLSLVLAIGCVLILGRCSSGNVSQSEFKQVASFSRAIVLATCSMEFSNFFINYKSLSSLIDLNYKGAFAKAQDGKGYSSTSLSPSPDLKNMLIGINKSVYRFDFLMKDRTLEFMNADVGVTIGEPTSISNHEFSFAAYDESRNLKYYSFDFQALQLQKSNYDVSITGKMIYKKPATTPFIMSSGDLIPVPDGFFLHKFSYVDYEKEFGWLFSEDALDSASPIDEDIVLWDKRTRTSISRGHNARFGMNGEIYFLKDGKTLCRADKEVKKIDKIISIHPHDSFAESIIMNHDRSVLTLHTRKDIFIFDLKNKEYMKIPASESIRVYSAVYPD